MGIGEDGAVGEHSEDEGFAVGAEGDFAGAGDADVEEAAAGDCAHFSHHGDVFGERGFEGDEVVAVDEDGFVGE